MIALLTAMYAIMAFAHINSPEFTREALFNLVNQPPINHPGVIVGTEFPCGDELCWVGRKWREDHKHSYIQTGT